MLIIIVALLVLTALLLFIVELFLIPGATHIKTYYVPEYVDQAVAKLAAFFNDNL